MTFDLASKQRLTVICESYRIRRDAITQYPVPPTHLQFARFCNDNALLLERALRLPTRYQVHALYRRVHLKQVSLDTEANSTALRELLGTLLGLHDLREQKVKAAQHT